MPAPTPSMLLLALNGLRVDEALSRDVEHLQTERGHQVLRLRRRDGPAATAPLAAPLVHALHLDGRVFGPLLVGRTGRRLDEPRRPAARSALDNPAVANDRDTAPQASTSARM